MEDAKKELLAKEKLIAKENVTKAEGYNRPNKRKSDEGAEGKESSDSGEEEVVKKKMVNTGNEDNIIEGSDNSNAESDGDTDPSVSDSSSSSSKTLSKVY